MTSLTRPLGWGESGLIGLSGRAKELFATRAYDT
jgi:hypothetical protein